MPIQAYLDDLHARFAASTTARSPPTSPSSRKADPELVRHLRRDDRRPRLRGRRHATSRSRSSRSPSRSSTAWRSRTTAATRCSSRSASSRPATRSTRSASSRATGRPLNPMINAGAIATDVAGRRRDQPTTRCERIARRCSRRYAGRARSRSTRPSTARSATTGHRNRAIGHMLRNFDILDGATRAAPSTSTSSSARSLVDCRDLGADGGDARQRRRQPGAPASARSRAELRRRACSAS